MCHCGLSSMSQVRYLVRLISQVRYLPGSWAGLDHQVGLSTARFPTSISWCGPNDQTCIPTILLVTNGKVQYNSLPTSSASRAVPVWILVNFSVPLQRVLC
jgi:hypothetical protein